MTRDESYAYESESGLICFCATTGLSYTPLRARIEPMGGGRRYVQSYCRFCDVYGHWRGQAAFDPGAPQPHMHVLRTKE